LKRAQKSAFDGYKDILNDEVARELARINLPLSLYTEWYWQIDLHNLFHFLELRLDWHAQLEIREYARVMSEITKKVAPIAYEAFEEYVLNTRRIGKKDAERVAEIIKKHAPDLWIKLDWE
jgi:thymidylate synthase (FAD)